MIYNDQWSDIFTGIILQGFIYSYIINMPSNGPAEKIIYELKGIPLFTYGMIGITTFVLAYITFTDVEKSTDNIENPLNPLLELPTTLSNEVSNIYQNMDISKEATDLSNSVSNIYQNSDLSKTVSNIYQNADLSKTVSNIYQTNPLSKEGQMNEEKDEGQMNEEKDEGQIKKKDEGQRGGKTEKSKRKTEKSKMKTKTKKHKTKKYKSNK
jgi:hypothetical protein